MLQKHVRGHAVGSNTTNDHALGGHGGLEFVLKKFQP